MKKLGEPRGSVVAHSGDAVEHEPDTKRCRACPKSHSKLRAINNPIIQIVVRSELSF